MVTFVVSSFLPYAVDFHELDTPTLGQLQRVSSSRTNSGVDLRKLGRSPSSRNNSSRDLASLGKQDSSASLLEEGVCQPLASILLDEEEEVEDEGEAEFSTPPEHNSSLVNILGPPSSGVDPLTTTPKTDLKAWLRPEAHNDSISQSEILDQPTNPRMDSVVASNTHLMPETRKTPDQNLKPISPGHARKSSLAFIEQLDLNKPETHVEYKFDDSKWTVEPAVQCNGGLINAIRKSDIGKSTETIWIGAMSGVETDYISEGRKEEIANKFYQEYGAHVLYISDDDMNGHYQHFCKIILWPVLHYHMPDNPKAKAYQENSWKFYKKVNQIYANKVLESYKDGDAIWIHDYHLMLVPGMIRARITDAKIGFFMHTGFPSAEIWRCVCSRRELLRGMLGADIIGFQTLEYAQHFRLVCSRMLVTEITEEGVYFDDRFIKVIYQPIGLVHEAIEECRRDQYHQLKKWTHQIEKTFAGKILIMGRDKMDNVRGIRQKLLAYEHFLARNPETRKDVVLMQIATSTTELVELQTSVFDIVWRINERYASVDYNPLEFLVQDMAYPNYLALASAADIMLLTSLREGMGLTAQEFVYCQDGKISNRKHGQIILSEFCGTSVLFAGNDMPCNPWDSRHMAEQIERAIAMSAEEKEERWLKLRHIVESATGGDWWAALQYKLQVAYDEHRRRAPAYIPRLDVRDLVDSYNDRKKRLVILDHENTLASDKALPKQHEDLCRTLTTLTADPQNLVYITSSLDPSALEPLYATVPNLGLIASKGAFTCPAHPTTAANAHPWREAEPASRVQDWKDGIAKVLKYYMDRLSGATLHETRTTYTIDYTPATKPDAALAIVGDFVTHINEACRSLRIRATPLTGKKIVIESMDYDKGTAVRAVYDEAGWTEAPFDFILAAGDGREDECVFEWAKEAGLREGWGCRTWTVSLGNTITEAESTLAGGPGAMIGVLERMAVVSREKIRERMVQAQGGRYARGGGRPSGLDGQGDEVVEGWREEMAESERKNEGLGGGESEEEGLTMR